MLLKHKRSCNQVVSKEIQHPDPLPRENSIRLKDFKGSVNEVLMLQRLDGDRDLIAKMATLFLAGLPQQLSDIQEAITNHNCKKIAFGCHALKGSVGNFSNQMAFIAAQELEDIAESGDLREAAGLYRILDAALQRLKPSVQRLVTV